MFQVTGTTDTADATLFTLVIQQNHGGPIGLNPTFSSATDSYTASVGNYADDITVVANPNNVKAQVAFLDGMDATIDDDESTADGLQTTLAVGSNTIKVKVTAENGVATKTYTLSLTRAALRGADRLPGERGLVREHGHRETRPPCFRTHVGRLLLVDLHGREQGLGEHQRHRFHAWRHPAHGALGALLE